MTEHDHTDEPLTIARALFGPNHRTPAADAAPDPDAATAAAVDVQLLRDLFNTRPTTKEN